MILLAQPHPFSGIMVTETVLQIDGAGNTISGPPVSGADVFSRWGMTHFASVMMIVWAVLIVITGALMLYRAKLQGNEMDQVSLDDTFAREAAENRAIADKVNKVQPAIRVMNWLVIIATVFVVGYWAWDIVKQIQ
jgi:hypothetical protein